MANSNLKEVVSRMQRISRRLVDVRRDVGALTREVQTLLDELDRLMPGLTDPDGAAGMSEWEQRNRDAYKYASGQVYTEPDPKPLPNIDPYRKYPVTNGSTNTDYLLYDSDLWGTDSRGAGE